MPSVTGGTGAQQAGKRGEAARLWGQAASTQAGRQARQLLTRNKIEEGQGTRREEGRGRAQEEGRGGARAQEEHKGGWEEATRSPATEHAAAVRTWAGVCTKGRVQQKAQGAGAAGGVPDGRQRVAALGKRCGAGEGTGAANAR